MVYIYYALYKRDITESLLYFKGYRIKILIRLILQYLLLTWIVIILSRISFNGYLSVWEKTSLNASTVYSFVHSTDIIPLKSV